jgi:hypothetical protein
MNSLNNNFLSVPISTAESGAPNETDPWFGHQRPVLTVSEVAIAFAIGESQVRSLVDSGVFAAAGIHGGSLGRRVHLRIERWSVIAWRLNLLAEQGQELPFGKTPQVIWWREELRTRNKRRTSKVPALK